ncbi:MAG: DUF5906 domain-containing protein [Pseudomonadales bacterium]
MELIANKDLLIKMIVGRYVQLDSAQDKRNIVDTRCTNAAPMTPDLALRHCLTRAGLGGIADSQAIAEAFTQVQRESLFTVCRNKTYIPQPVENWFTSSYAVIEKQGYNYLNNWRKPDWLIEVGKDISPFLELLERMFPSEKERLHILKWLYMLVFHPEKKSWAPVLIGPQGTGKSLFLQTAKKLVGESNCYITANHKAVVGGFNAVWMDTVLVGIEEVKNVDNPLKFANQLKLYISDIEQAGERKGSDIERFNCYSKVAICSNADLPFPIEGDDRRFSIFRVEHKENAEETKGFGRKYSEWLNDQEAYAIDSIANWLLKNVGPIVKVSEWSVNAPLTDTKQEVIEASKPEWKVRVDEFLEERIAVSLKDLEERVDVKPRTIATYLQHHHGATKWDKRPEQRGQKHTVYVLPTGTHLLNDEKKLKAEVFKV